MAMGTPLAREIRIGSSAWPAVPCEKLVLTLTFIAICIPVEGDAFEGKVVAFLINFELTLSAVVLGYASASCPITS